MAHSHNPLGKSPTPSVSEDAKEAPVTNDFTRCSDSKAFCDRVTAGFQDAKERLAGTEQLAINKAKDMAKVADSFVHENPWQAVGVAAAVGILVGLFVSRR